MEVSSSIINKDEKLFKSLRKKFKEIENNENKNK